MTHFIPRIGLLALFFLLSTHASAQFNIRNKTADTLNTTLLRDTLSDKPLQQLNFKSDAFERAMRKKRHREHNLIECEVAMNVSQKGFDNWSNGGDNTFSGRLTFDFLHRVTHDKLTIQSKIGGRYGINIIDDKPFKNEDKLTINEQINWSINKYFAYSSTVDLNTQFSKGYRSRDDKTLRSNFMSPGVLQLALGITFKGPKSPLSITLSPITGSLTTVLYEPLRKLGLNGVTPGKSSKSQLGSSVKVNFDKKFYKNILRFKSDFDGFYNYNIPANFRWTGKFEVCPTNFIIFSTFVDMVYNREMNTPKDRYMQYNYVIGIELRHKFSNRWK